MSSAYSNDVVEDLIWSEIQGSTNACDFITFTQHFPVLRTRHWLEALDQAVSLFRPENPESEGRQSLYPAAFERVRLFARDVTDPATKANTLFHLGKMLHEGFGVEANREQSINLYKEAYALGEIRALINCGAHYDGPQASEEDLAFAHDLYDRALEKGEPMGLIRKGDRMSDENDPARYELYFQAAEMGSVAGMQRVGFAHMLGNLGKEKDESVGLSWLQRAAKLGCATSSGYLGWYYDQEDHQDKSLSVEWHQLAARQGHKTAMRVLGLKPIIEPDGPIAFEEGWQWLLRSAVLGDRHAQFNVGRELLWRDDRSQDVNAYQWLKFAADRGHTYAAWRVAVCHREGLGCEKSSELSAQYCMMAAKAGYPEAQGQLGIFYWYGDGLEKNEDKAYQWINLSALQGEPKSIFLLGFLTDLGVGCIRDPIEAFRLYRQAADKGDVDAIRRLGDCHLFGNGTEKDPAQAAIFYQRAAAKGDAKAMTDLGSLFFDGDGVLTDYERAFEWFSKAAEHNDAQGMYMLALLYANGDGVAEDHELCRRWMSKSAMLGFRKAKEWIEENLPKTPGWLEKLVDDSTREPADGTTG